MKDFIKKFPVVRDYLEYKKYERRLDLSKLSIGEKTKMMMDFS